MIIKLEEFYSIFKGYLISVDGHFTSFDNPHIKRHEDYKKTLESEGYKNLKIETWNLKIIGNGHIIECVKAAVNTKGNNLVIHDNRRGENARQDKALYQDFSKDELKEFEKYLFDFYKSNISDEESFNNLLKYCGKIYPFMAYLFFLKSAKLYLPIAPRTFDSLFKKLNINFSTSGKCSWENYSEYISIITEVKGFLSQKTEHENEDIALLDAHSFLWIIMKHIPANLNTGTQNYSIIFKKITPSHSGLELPKYVANKDYTSNHDKLQKRKELVGKKSEEIVLNYEKEKHINHKYFSLIKNVSANNSLGYDIQSIDENGNLKFIEVKTEGFNKSFIISRNEITRLNETENHFIYVVNHKNSTSEINELDLKEIKLEGKKSINGIEFYPLNFRVHF